jgi:RimJ/RimL family protein N-acetyltransferase
MTRNHDVVTTARLDVVPLSPALVAALVVGDLSRAAALAPFPLDAGTFAGDAYVLALRHDQLTADPSEEPWAAVLRATGVVVARAGFHASPDDRGTVEIGYSVGPAYRRQGFATELAAGLIAWARRNGARRCLASVRPDNLASLRTIGRLGFVRTGEQVDEIDGLEWVFTLELDRALRHPVAPR